MPANTPSVSDVTLIQQSRNGDESAYGQMVERYQSLVCSVAYSRCGDLGMSEDLAQEAFIQAWKKLADLSDANKFKSWICTIVRNMASRSREKSTRNVASDAARLESVVEPTAAANDPIENVISAEQEQLVWQAIAGIPENYREPMVLFYREEQSVARVAEALDISQDAVKQRLSRGRKFLQAQLAATVEATLENSRPSNAFTNAVLLGLSSAKVNSVTATSATVATSVAGKAAAAGAGFNALFLAPLVKLPLIAWLLKTGFDESRSSRERKLTIQFLAFWFLAFIPMVALMFWSKLSPPVVMVIFLVPMVVSSYWLGKRIEKLRDEEKTSTPLRSIFADPEDQAAKMRMFLGNGLLIAIWPLLLSVLSADWLSVIVLLVSTGAISLAGSRFCGSRPTRSFRVYALSLGCIAMVGIGILCFREFAWTASKSNQTQMFVFLGTMNAMLITNVILATIAWKRVYGKSN